MGLITYLSSMASKYGLAWIIVTQTLAWITFIGIYAALYYYDLDVVEYLKNWGYDSPSLIYIAEKGGLLTITFALNRILMPVRLGISVLILPLIANPINLFIKPYWIYFFPPKSAPYKPVVIRKNLKSE
jgi:hypothetical protein